MSGDESMFMYAEQTAGRLCSEMARKKCKQTDK